MILIMRERTRTMVYLDSAATTPVCENAARAVLQSLREEFANPSSRHFAGVQAMTSLERSRKQIAAALGAQAEEIYFTSGGTEANNLAIFGAVEAAAKFRGKKKIVISAIEHSSVMDSAAHLEQKGYEVVRLQPDRFGNITAQQLFEAIDENTILVSMMLVNNELGSVLPASVVEGIIKAKKAPALYHCDCVQAFCKQAFTVKSLGADLISVSAHKIFGPKGVGALYVKKGVRLLPRTFGGEQESRLRPGTQATALIAGFAAAVEHYNTRENGQKVKELNTYAREALENWGVPVWNSDKNASPYILNFSLPDFRSEIILNYLSQRGFCVSAGSACAKGKPSHVLRAVTGESAIADAAIRLSFTHQNTKEEIDALVAALREATQTLAH